MRESKVRVLPGAQLQMTGLVSVGSPKSSRVASIATICANGFFSLIVRKSPKGTVAKGVLLRETENLDMSARLGPVPHREVYCFNI